MALYRKARPDELLGATVLLDGGNVVETPRKKRAGDRHKDPKAHSAKTAARAKAKRAAK